MKKRMFATMLAVVTMATALTGCSTESAKQASDGQAPTATAQTEAKTEAGSSGAETTTEAADKELKTVSFQLDGSAVPYYSPLYLAQENGYFAEEGLNVEFYYAAAADIVKNVAAGNVEFGFPNADAVVAARAQGIPVQVVHTTYQE